MEWETKWNERVTSRRLKAGECARLHLHWLRCFCAQRHIGCMRCAALSYYAAAFNTRHVRFFFRQLLATLLAKLLVLQWANELISHLFLSYFHWWISKHINFVGLSSLIHWLIHNCWRAHTWGVILPNTYMVNHSFCSAHHFCVLCVCILLRKLEDQILTFFVNINPGGHPTSPCFPSSILVVVLSKFKLCTYEFVLAFFSKLIYMFKYMNLFEFSS